ncbi:MAG: hypothetical protein U0930_16735 [Pirellulales bacterium]
MTHRSNLLRLATCFALLSLCHLTNGTSSAQEAEKLVIREAVYGDLPDGNKSVVTDKVAKLVKENKLRVEAGNDLFGDPAEQVGKKLLVKYTLGGKDMEAGADEGETLLLPIPKLVGELKILAAKYGDLPNGDSADVLELVSKSLKDNRLEFTADNDVLGDPAPGVFKRLRVEYQIGDVKLAKSVYEGGKLVIRVPAKEQKKEKIEKVDLPLQKVK